MLRLPLKTLAVAACFAGLAGAAQAATVYKTVLSGANEVPPNASPATGDATIVVDGDLLTLTVNFSGLTAPATASHIHCCTTPSAGVATQLPSFVGFPNATSGTYNQTFDLTLASTYNPAFVTAQGDLTTARDALLSGIANGTAYLNIHTSNFPGGEIRGSFSAVPEPQAWALMIVGFGAAGAILRRRRAPAFA
ncbi:MAG TPA: CHRD domain-containing protein [Phenylobacterium sp.]|uniref:CHRD domain-containing protein n=1 Tax=Phenylobacterium koreense TaxID=266125 RepID=A0ABV2ELK7_9CAUL